MPPAFLPTRIRLPIATVGRRGRETRIKGAKGIRKMGADTLKFLRSTLDWLENLEQTPDPALDAESVAALKDILISRIAKHEREEVAIFADSSATAH
jgi:hypothetical protein